MKQLLKLALALLIVHCTLLIDVNAQVGINNDNSDPDASAMLDVKSSDKGMLVPRMDSTARTAILNPAVGLLVYDSTTTTFWYYDEMKWNEIRNASQVLDAKDLVRNLSEPDFSCLQLLEEVNLSEAPKGIASSEEYLFLTEENLFKVMEVSDPVMPSVVGSLSVSSNSRGLLASGDYVYMSSGSQLIIVDISDPTMPSEVGTLVAGSFIRDKSVSGNYVYLASSDDLEIIDVSDPSIPNLVTSFDIGLEAIALDAEGDYVYLVDRDFSNGNKLKAIDVSDAAMPSEVSSVGLGVSPRDVEVVGNYAYVVEDIGNSKLRVIDISNPTNLNQITSLNLPQSPSNIQVAGNYLYLLSLGGGTFTVIDISTPDSPVFITQSDSYIDFDAMAILGNYNYITYESNSLLRIFQLSCTQNLITNPLDGSIETSTPLWEVTSDTSISTDNTVIATAFIGDGSELSNLPNTNTDSQQLSFDSNTDVLSLTDGGSVDLSSINTDTDTDNQQIDVLNLNGSTLEISLTDDGEVTKTLDLSSLAPVGTIQMWPTATPPSGWLICNGNTFNASTYPELNTVLGGNTLPNFSGRFPLGVGNSGTQGAVNHNLSTTGGQEDVTLNINQMPSHNHGAGSLTTQFPYLSDNNTGNERYRDGSDARLYESSSISGNTGGGQAHENMPPFYTINFIIKAE